MTHVPTAALADQARKHLGEAGPNNTCVSNGPELWARELGLPTLGTASVTEARRLAKAGHNGWRYVEGTRGIARGHIADWDPNVLGDPDDRHVCVVDALEHGSFRGIGSGTPSGKVAHQPANGGMNPLGVLVGYLIAPNETTAAHGSTTPKPQPDLAGEVYTVRPNDTLLRIAGAHNTTKAKLLKLNPALPSHKSADFHIARANLVVIGQRIRVR